MVFMQEPHGTRQRAASWPSLC